MDGLETTSGIGWWGIVIVFILLFAVFGNGNLFGNRGFGGFGSGFAWGEADGLYGFRNYKATCDAEKAEIINTARTQFLTVEQAAQTNALINSTANATQARMDYYQYQGLRDAVTERDQKIAELKNMLFVKEQLAPVNAALASIQCNMLQKPQITGFGVVQPNAAVLNGLGVGSPLAALAGYGYGCGCGANSVVA